MNKAFDDFLWENYPSINTPLGKRLLNKVNSALNIIDERVRQLFNIEIPTIKNTKLDITEAYGLVKGISLDEKTGVFTVTFYNNTQATIDTMLEKLAVNFDYYADTQKLVIILSDGTQKEVDLSALITQYEFLDSDTVHFTISSTGKVVANVKEGSIEEKHLRPDYLSDIRVEVHNAEESAEFSAGQAIMAESFAHGTTGRRPGEDTDNAKYYSEQAKIHYDNLQQAGAVTGVKGNAETNFRKGNVNIAKADIGLGNVDNTADKDKSVKSAKTLANVRTIFGKNFDGSQNVAGQGLFYGTYVGNASSRYNNSGLQVRENGAVGNSQSDIAYAPSIGFHWMNRVAASLALDRFGVFHFFNQDGVTLATVEARVTRDGLGNNIANTYATKAENAWKKLKTLAYGNSTTASKNVNKEIKIVAYVAGNNGAAVHGIYDFPISILDIVIGNELYFGEPSSDDAFFYATINGNSVLIVNEYKGMMLEVYAK